MKDNLKQSSKSNMFLKITLFLMIFALVGYFGYSASKGTFSNTSIGYTCDYEGYEYYTSNYGSGCCPVGYSIYSDGVTCCPYGYYYKNGVCCGAAMNTWEGSMCYDSRYFDDTTVDHGDGTCTKTYTGVTAEQTSGFNINSCVLESNGTTYTCELTFDCTGVSGTSVLEATETIIYELGCYITPDGTYTWTDTPVEGSTYNSILRTEENCLRQNCAEDEEYENGECVPFVGCGYVSSNVDLELMQYFVGYKAYNGATDCCSDIGFSTCGDTCCTSITDNGTAYVHDATMGCDVSEGFVQYNETCIKCHDGYTFDSNSGECISDGSSSDTGEEMCVYVDGQYKWEVAQTEAEIVSSITTEEECIDANDSSSDDNGDDSSDNNDDENNNNDGNTSNDDKYEMTLYFDSNATLYVNGNAVSNESSYVEEFSANEKYDLSDYVVKKNRYTFKGWDTSINCKSPSKSGTYTINSDVGLFACFKSNSSINNNENSYDDNQNVTDNPKTGSIAIFMIWVISIAAIGCAFMYFKKIREN